MQKAHEKKLNKLSNDEAFKTELTEEDLKNVAGGARQTCEDCPPENNGGGTGGNHTL